MAVDAGNFTVVDSVYGRFLINRHAVGQADALIRTGRTHFEEEVQKILAIARTLPANAIAVDAGANIGMVAMPLAQVMKASGGTVLAFEVQRMLHYALCGTAALNELHNLFVYHQAVGAEPGWLTVPRPDYGVAQDFGLLSLVGVPADAAGDQVSVIRIDDLGLPSLDFLKIDVEGMEIDVLRGAAATVKAHLPWCWIESWKAGVEPIKATFGGLPYRFYQISSLDLLCVPGPRLEASKLAIAATEV
jgi:FkbM family methyltransferase